MSKRLNVISNSRRGTALYEPVGSNAKRECVVLAWKKILSRNASFVDFTRNVCALTIILSITKNDWCNLFRNQNPINLLATRFLTKLQFYIRRNGAEQCNNQIYIQWCFTLCSNKIFKLRKRMNRRFFFYKLFYNNHTLRFNLYYIY